MSEHTEENMKNHSSEYSRENWSHQDLHRLLQRGRTLHDQAVFEFFSGLTEQVQQLFRKLTANSTHGSKVRYQNHRGLPSSR